MSRSERSDTYENPDGTFTKRMYTTAANAKGADGTWRPIDTRVVSDGDDRYRNVRGAVDFRFNANADDEIVGASGPDWSLGFKLERAAAGRPAEISGSTVTYRDVLPSTDVTYEVQHEALKETVVLRRPPLEGDLRLRFPLRLEGLKAAGRRGRHRFPQHQERDRARRAAWVHVGLLGRRRRHVRS